MRTIWTWVPSPHHIAGVDEIMEVRWSDYYGAALFGDRQEIARLPHRGCRLEIVATAPSSHRQVDSLLAGHFIAFKGSRYLLSRFELPGGATVGLWHLVGFKLRLLPEALPPVPSEDAILRRALARPQFAAASPAT